MSTGLLSGVSVMALRGDEAERKASAKLVARDAR
jgi:hypothetical protein